MTTHWGAHVVTDVDGLAAPGNAHAHAIAEARP